MDLQGAALFDIDNLPELSKDRILDSQIDQLYKLATMNHPEMYFD
ncbi:MULTISPECIES: NUDIX hydrolase [Arenibacter]|jgi:hypothetical protein|nr:MULTISPECIES: hypothetical protein [Arenibacter]